MKKLLVSMMMITGLAKADVTISNLTATVVVPSSNTVTIAKAKVIYTAIAIEKIPPKYDHVVFRIAFFIKDTATGKEIPGTRGTTIVSSTNAIDIATKKLIDLPKIQDDMDKLANAFLRKKINRD